MALFNLAMDSKLRARDLLRLRVSDITQGNQVASRATVMQQKTGRPVQFEITEQTRQAVSNWIRRASTRPSECCRCSRYATATISAASPRRCIPTPGSLRYSSTTAAPAAAASPRPATSGSRSCGRRPWTSCPSAHARPDVLAASNRRSAATTTSRWIRASPRCCCASFSGKESCGRPGQSLGRRRMPRAFSAMMSCSSSGVIWAAW